MVPLFIWYKHLGQEGKKCSDMFNCLTIRLTQWLTASIIGR